ncbi:hypothetical protein BGW42_005547 [Actinomortierella wolfii]|nr:hypothetical protein BGW42_005547 [Actinomortierella wolfii]
MTDLRENNRRNASGIGSSSSSSSSSSSQRAGSSSSSSASTASTTPVTLNIKTLESTTHAVSIQLNKKVADLKQLLHEKLEVPTNRQRLIYRGQLMRDERVLKDYALEDGHTLHLVTRPEDALPTNQRNDESRSGHSATVGGGSSGSSLRFTPGEYQVSIIGVDGDADPQSYQQIVQALTDSLGMGADAGAPTVIRLNSDLTHLPTIEAELARAAAQLRNIQTILAQPDNDDEDVELEPLDVPHLESVRDDVDGDVVDVSALSDLLRQLSEANRSMANHLHNLSTRYQRGRIVDMDHSALQQASIRTARAMYRLSSVQNTVFPMLANASFEGSGSGSTNYRYLPSRTWPRQGGTGSTIPLSGGASGRSVSSNIRASPFTSGRATILPFTAVMNSGIGATSLNNTSAGLIPSLIAHARATARNVNAQTANATSSTNPSSRSNTGSAPIGMLARGADGNLSYTTQSPPSYSASLSDAALAELARTGFMDFWRQYGDQSNSHSNDPASNSSSNTASAGSSSTPSAAATATARAADSASRSAEAAVAAVQRASVALDSALLSSLQGRRRERPDDFSSEDVRPSTRRRLSDEHGQPRSMSDLEEAIRRELEAMYNSTTTSSSHSNIGNRTTRPTSTSATATVSPRQTSPPPQQPQVSRSNSNDARRIPTSNQGTVSPTGVSPGSSSPPTASTPTLAGPSSSSSSSSSQQSMGSPAYNLGRIGVFISALLRMVDQPREDGSPRTLADVVCNDADNRSTILQDLITSISESVTIRETRMIVEGFPAPLRNLHPVLNTFIREKALGGRQLTEENMDSVAVMLANGILNAVDFGEILETLNPPARIEISALRIRQMSAEVLREHFRRLIYMVVAVPLGRESSCSTFARDLILWIRDVVGAWRVAFYGLYPERDHSEAQRIATHVVGSAIHANGRRWVELSNRATNTLVNVLCANIVPRRRGEEQAGGLVGGAWPLMATTSRNRRACVGPSLLGSTAPPYASPSSSSSQNRSSSSSATSTTEAASGPLASLGITISDSTSNASRPSSSLLSNLEWMRPLPGETPTETQDRVMQRVKQAFMAGESLPTEWTTPTVLQAFMSGDVQGAMEAALAATPGTQGHSSSSASSSSTTKATSSNNSENGSNGKKKKEEEDNSKPSSSKKPDHRTRVEDASDEDMA